MSISNTVLKNKAAATLLDAMRSIAGTIFQPIWPILTIYTADIRLWGKVVDIWFFASIAGVILLWGSAEYLQKQFASYPSKINDFFVESFYARIPLLFIFIGFLVFAPYPPIMCISFVLMFTGMYINQSFNALYTFRKNDWKPLIANVLGTLVGVAYYIYRIDNLSLPLVLFAIGLAEISKAIVHLILNFKVLMLGKLRKINFELYITYFGQFSYTFSFILILTIDRFFVYTTFDEPDKAKYQIFMNFLTLIITLPYFITQYYNARGRKSKIRVDNVLRLKVFLVGVFVLSLSIYISVLLCEYVFWLPIGPQYTLAAFFFVFPSALYTPLVSYFNNRNNQPLLTRCALGTGISMISICGFLIKTFGMIGALYTGIIGQWIFMFLVTIFYEQDQISKKIKLIK